MKRSVYVNPHDYLVCPILALAMVVFSALDSMSPLVLGHRSAEQRFSEWMAATLRAYGDDIEIAGGLSADEYGTHSLRKGVATFLTGRLRSHSFSARVGRPAYSSATSSRRPR